jgi:hypothetical protein
MSGGALRQTDEKGSARKIEVGTYTLDVGRGFATYF